MTDRVESIARSRESLPHGLDGAEHADVQALGVLVGEHALDLRRNFAIVCPLGVKPEEGGRFAKARATHGERNPVAHGCVLRVACAENIAGLDGVRCQRRVVAPACRADLDSPVCRGDESFVVAAVFFGFLRHEADVRHGSHARRIECPVAAAVVNHNLVDGGIGAIGNDGKRIVRGTVGPPHFSARADHRGHARIHDDVARHVKIRDAAIRVDHRELGPLGEAVTHKRANRLGGLGIERLEAREDRAQTVVCRESRILEFCPEPREDLGEERAHRVTEDDGVTDLHHRGLEVEREQNVALAGPLNLSGEELLQGTDAHDTCVNNVAILGSHGVFEDRFGAVGGDMDDLEGFVAVNDEASFARAEVTFAHGGDLGARVGTPLAHAMRVGLREVFDCTRRAAVRIAFAEHRIDGGAFDGVVSRADVEFGVGFGAIRVVGEVVTACLKFGDRGFELRNRGRNVGKLDDVRLCGAREGAELGECITFALVLGEAVRECGEDASGE